METAERFPVRRSTVNVGKEFALVTSCKIMVVDDHAIIRDALFRVLQAEPDFMPICPAKNADEAVELARKYHPDIVLMDINMPGLNCFDGARRIQCEQPAVRFVFLTAFPYDSHIEQALEVGALGFLVKGEPVEKILHALREAAADRICFSDQISARLTVESVRARLQRGDKTRVSLLTRREKEVLCYIARGLATKEIAHIMSLSVRTVDNHRTHIMGKLNIHDRVALARFAIRESLVCP